MPSFVRAHVLGHCGKDLFVNDKGNMASFSIGTNYQETENGQKVFKPLWVKVICFGQQIEFLKSNFRKGGLVYAEGDVRMGGYTDKNNQPVKQLELLFAKVNFLDKKEEENKPAETSTQKDTFQDEDILF